MSEEIQSDSSNHPHESQVISEPISTNRPRPRLLYFKDSQEYLNIGLPQYKASVKCDWKAAKAILDNHPDMKLLRFRITLKGETALHIAAAAKCGPKKVADFVRNLVDIMETKDLELATIFTSTALSLAAAAGNLESVKIMMRKNPDLDTIAGGDFIRLESVKMPLTAAALYGNRDVVSYLYECSKDLADDRGWDDEDRIELLEKCVESDMFDIAEKIVEKYPELGRSGNLLAILARKPEAFHEKKSNIIRRTIKSISGFAGYKAGTPVKKSDALPLLRILLEDIVKLPDQWHRILEGPPDSIQSGSAGRIIQTIQLKELIFNHRDKLMEEAKKIREEGGQKRTLKLKNLVSKHIVKLHVETQSLIRHENTTDEDQALELQNLISQYIVKLNDQTQKILGNRFIQNEDEENDKEFERLLRHIEFPAIDLCDETNIRERQFFRVMFMAAEVGNTNFLLELIRRSPDLIWEVNDDNQTIFHVAVTHRHEGIYNLLYEIGAMKDMVIPLTDSDGNNMLHLAAMSTIKKNLEDVSGAALQMQRELLWFKEVESMIPPSYRERKNKDGFTPRELFTMEHQDLIAHGEKWMKSTASQCMVVATLIATIVFAAAFTVPGGYNQIDGIPMFKKKLSFVAFVVADAISLFLSSASILTFLSILTSRYAERDFVASLPMKLMLGLTTLFLSIGAMMVTFSVSFFVLYERGMKWIPIFIGLFAVTPAILYVALQYHLLIDVLRSTYGGKYLFKPERQVLFYENPKADQTNIDIDSE